MPSYHAELISAARHLIDRSGRPRGRLPQARIRRSISTAYYALFHFLLDEASRKVVGTAHALTQRRRIFVRYYAHAGILATPNKIAGANVDPSVAPFLQSAAIPGPFPTPPFARDMASAFKDAQSKRTDADYALYSPLTLADAQLLIGRVELAIAGWRDHNLPAGRGFKAALYLLMLQKGKLPG